MIDSIAILSNSNFDYLKGLVRKYINGDIFCSEYNQFYQYFLETEKNIPKNIENLFIWPSPETVSKSYKCLRNYENVEINLIEEEIYLYSKRIIELSKIYQNIFIPLFQEFEISAQSGIADMNLFYGKDSNLLRMNFYLMQNLKEEKNIHILNSYKWFSDSNNPLDSKLLLRAKIPFSNNLMSIIAKDLGSVFSTIRGNQKKLLVLDLDNTLWGGILGDDGWEHIKIGGHDIDGEAFLSFQKNLKRLKNKGVLLAISSKNEETLVNEVFEKNEYMHLKLDDFIIKKINWKDKAENILEISHEANLGLDSFVFIDDSPYERDRVRKVLPEVSVPEFPKDIIYLSDWLCSLNYFNSIFTTEEDLNRSKSYAEENKKKLLKEKSSSIEEWIDGLDIRISIRIITELDFNRALQLINKTNQMNLRTKRFTASEFKNFINQENINCYSVKVKDRISDQELMGVISIKKNKETLEVLDFLLSCRAFGKNIEKTMLGAINLIAKKMKLKIKKPVIEKTQKNFPCQNLFRENDLTNLHNQILHKENLIRFEDLRTNLDIDL